MDWGEFKLYLKKFWHFLWHDDSLLSWIVNIVLAFIIIKFIVYPGLGAIFGTELPLVAVISDSMHHATGFEDWWGETSCQETVCPYTAGSWYESQGITKEMFADYVLHNGFSKGDVIVLKGVDPLTVAPGDILVFNSGKPYPIIHRVFAVNDSGSTLFYQTKGDNNAQPIVAPDLNELAVAPAHLRGKAVARIPYLGYVKLLAVDFLQIIGLA